MSFQIHEVKEAAAGHWAEIFWALAPQLRDAITRAPNHVPCPLHGGTNGFRLFPHWEETGAAICNTCGAFNDGFKLLQALQGWSFAEVVNRVGAFLRLESNKRTKVIETLSEGSKFSGIVKSLGESTLRNGRKCFQVRFVDGSVHWGTDLKRACEVASVVAGDKIELTLVARQLCENSSGHRFNKCLWSAKRLPTPEEARTAEAKRLEDIERKRQNLRAVWKASVPVNLATENAVSRYFANRGINETELLNPLKLGADLRFIAELEYADGDENGKFPALLCVVRNVDGEAVTLHRIYLTEEGKKAPVSTPKKLMPLAGGGLNGCAIRIGEEPGDTLCLAEGVETALSVFFATGLPCWSTISAHGLEAVDIPESVKTVYVFADKDKSLTGQKAAAALKAKVKALGKTCVVLLPDEPIEEGKKGVDWNDHLIAFGRDSFPI